MKKIYFFTFIFLFNSNLNAIHLKNGTNEIIELVSCYKEAILPIADLVDPSDPSTCITHYYNYPAPNILKPKSTIEIDYYYNNNGHYTLTGIQIKVKDQKIKEISDETMLKSRKYFLILKTLINPISSDEIWELKEITKEEFSKDQFSCIIL